MDVAIGLLKIYMHRGVVDEMALTPLFSYFFESYPDLTLTQKMDIFIDITKMRKDTDYPNTWVDLDFPTDSITGMPIHPTFEIDR
jgi:hypothetical protein